MSLENIEFQMKNFLSSKDPEVLAIRGHWGTGKTFTWRETLKECKNEIGLSKYSYVSLFGVNDLNTLKTTLFANTVSKADIGKDLSLEIFDKSLSNLIGNFKEWRILKWLRSSSGYLPNIPKLNNFSGIMEIIAFHNLKDTIVCIDDFERRGSNLKLRDVLGLITMLKEQRGCKIVLIFNDEHFSKEENDEYRIYREKVIDKQLFFDITPRECVTIVFGTEDKLFEQIASFAESLNIKNIRIIQKVKTLADILDSILHESFDAGVLKEALQSLVLYMFSFYSHDPTIPTLEYLKSYSPVNIDDLSDQEKKWNIFLRRYRYKFTSDFDLVIAKGVENGYFDMTSLIYQATQMNSNVLFDKARRKLSDIWFILRSTFKNNQHEIIEFFINHINEYYIYTRPTELDQIISMLRYLNQDDQADKLILFYMDKLRDRSNVDIIHLYNELMNGQSILKIKDTKFHSALLEFINEHKNNTSLHRILLLIDKSSSWSEEQESQLDTYTMEEYYELFISDSGDQLWKLIDAAQLFSSVQNPSVRQKSICEKVNLALIKIANETKLNAYRLAGIPACSKQVK